MQSVCLVKYVINKTFDKQESCLIKAKQHLIPLSKFSAKLICPIPTLLVLITKFLKTV